VSFKAGQRIAIVGNDPWWRRLWIRIWPWARPRNDGIYEVTHVSDGSSPLTISRDESPSKD
jgi:hypothetical protein